MTTENEQLLSEYERRVITYAKQQFTNTSYNFLKKLVKGENVAIYQSKFPLLKLILHIVKKFMLNDLEVFFFGYFFDQNGWKFEDLKDVVEKNNIDEFIKFPDLEDIIEYRALNLYILLIGFTVKKYLNDIKEVEIYKKHLENIIPNFQQIYSKWIKDGAKSLFTLNPTILNQIFKRYSMNSDDTRELLQDYNTLVDNIIDISPPNKYANRNKKVISEDKINSSSEDDEQKKKVKDKKTIIEKIQKKVKCEQKEQNIQEEQFSEENNKINNKSNNNNDDIQKPEILDANFINEYIKNYSSKKGIIPQLGEQKNQHDSNNKQKQFTQLTLEALQQSQPQFSYRLDSENANQQLFQTLSKLQQQDSVFPWKGESNLQEIKFTPLKSDQSLLGFQQSSQLFPQQSFNLQGLKLPNDSFIKLQSKYPNISENNSNIQEFLEAVLRKDNSKNEINKE